MAERRNSLQPEPAVPRNNKRRRTMMDSVSDVARWLLPSWASEGTAESSQDRHIQAASGHLSAAGTGLSNGERNPKRARPNEVSRREPMGRLSPVASVAPSTTSAQIEPDLDDGSDSSTSGCSSLSITTPANAEACSTADAKSNQRRNRPIQNTKESKTRDVSISVDQTSIVAETSVTASPSLNFSLFSRPSRALSSTMNASLPLAGSHGSGTRSLSSSLHKPERSLNRSIFYEGKTTYGGAAAHRKLNLFSPSPYQMAARRGKPTSNVNVPESSSAAKRLIEALERMNTPVQNAKKIPLGRPESIPTLNSEARRKEALESIASLRQSSAPPPLSSCRNSVQPARIGSNVKPVLSSSSGYPIDVDESDAVLPSNASNVPVITPTPRTTSALLDNFESDRANTAGGKMKSAKTIQQHMSRKIPVEEEPPPTAPDLPSAPLPIKDLPSFSFATKPPSIAVSSTQDCHKTSAIRSPLTSLADFSNKPFEKQQMPSSLVCPASDPSEAFTFAAPVDLDKPTKTLHCKEEFDFKDPLYLKKDQHNRSGGFAVAGPTMISGNTFTLKTKTVPESTKIAVPEVLSTGSVMDIIGKNDTRKDGPEANTSASDTSKTSVWECPKCLVRNPSGVCQACESKKASTSATSIVTSAPPSLTTSVANSWGDQFKRPTSSWDCSSCLVNNKSEESSCVACGAAKPGADNSKSAAKPFGTTVANQWGDLFKKPAGQWSCKSCMLDNKPEATKCAACETPNPSAKAPSASASASPAPVSTVKSPLSAMIKMAPGWSCDTCLVRNDLDKTKCVACETPKPGSVAAQDSTNAPKAISSAFKFGVPTSDENKNITSEPVTLVFGMKSTDKGASDGSSVPNGGFKFGLTPAKPTEEKNSTEQTNSATKTSATPEFSFGTPANSVATSLTPQTSAAPAIGTPAKTPAASSSGTTALSTGGTSANFSGFGTSWASGTANKTDAPSSGLFTFGASSTPSTSAPAVSAVTTQKTFAFGATSTTPAAQPSAATFNFGATTAASSAAPTTTAPVATFTFAGFATPAKPPAAGGLFGPAPATSAFGANTTVTTATTSQPTASASFSFTSPASTGTTATPTVTATTSVSATPSPMFTFGNPSATANSSETQNSGAAFVFGSSSSTAGRLSGFGFGPAATTAASAASTFSFGASAAPAATTIPTVSNGPSVFGSGSLQSSTPFGVTSTNPAAAAAAPAPATNSVFQFNSNPTAAAPGSTTPFTFTAGVSSTAAAPSSGGLFAFGASNTNTAAPPPATNSATVPGAATPFQFGASSSTVTATPAAAPAPNDMFNFAGAPAAPAAGTFQFGAQPPGQNPAPFQFGASAPTLAPTLGFPTPNAENPFNATITQGRRMRRAVRRRGAR